MTELYTILDMAKILRVPKRTIYLFAQEGKIPGAFKIGRHWRFRKDMIEEWVDEQTRSKYTTGTK